MAMDLINNPRKISFVWALMLLSPLAHARPEYALRLGQNRCTTCHYSPAGGGPKTVTGKYFGAGPFAPSPYSNQDLFGADIKALYYLPEHHGNSSNGAGIMAVNVYASVPVTMPTKDTNELRVVAEHNLGGFQSGPRNLYFRWRLTPEMENSWLPQYVVIGRFMAPFGLMTDEHRTYVRIQTNTNWNTAFDTGLMFSGNPYSSIHYDLALFNGQKNPGTISTGQATQWGGLINLRHMPSRAPVMVGASGSYYEPMPNSHPPSAWSIYSALSIHRLTTNRIPVTLLTEFATAKNWNSAVAGSSFLSDPTGYGNSVKWSRSRGWLVQVNWDYSARLVFTYKFDYLVLNDDFPSDAFRRHGVGVKYYLGPNTWTQLRLEAAEAGHPNEHGGSKVGASDAAWAVLSTGI